MAEQEAAQIDWPTTKRLADALKRWDGEVRDGRDASRATSAGALEEITDAFVLLLAEHGLVIQLRTEFDRSANIERIAREVLSVLQNNGFSVTAGELLKAITAGELLKAIGR